MHTYTNLSVDKILKPISYYINNSSKYKIEEIFDIKEKILKSFSNLIYNDSEHKYFLEGIELTPVTKICHFFEESQDFTLIAQKYAKKNNLDWVEVKRQWDLKSLLSKEVGNSIHKFAEGFHYLILGEEDKFKSIGNNNICEDYYLPYSLKQNAIIKYFYDILNQGEIPVVAECKIYWKELKISGTLDSLVYSKEIDGFIIRDYKNNEEMKKSFIKPLLFPFQNYNTEPLSNYILQCNLYQCILENIGINIKRRELVWVKDSGNYELISLPNETQKLREFLPKILNV